MTKNLAYRGFMLDVSRHYMPPDDIRRLLDAAALCGLNRMHWHLTDDQGWRIDIRRYPLLTRTGAVRGASCFGDVPAGENNCGFYTQEEIRAIVAYAAERSIDIIPEIEIPGHASAMLAAYPHLGCRLPAEAEKDYEVQVSGGIFPNLACAGKDETIRFLEDVLDEVCELFPAPMVHIGGDEALKLHWRRCPDCQRRMREQGLDSEDALQRWLILRIGEHLAAKGKQTIVWNDVLAGGLLPEHFIVQQWNGGEEQTRAFLRSGGRVIRSETDSCYLDYCYGKIDVRTVWEYPAVPAYAEGTEDRILGVECPLWTERVTNLRRAAWQLFPRLTAMAVRLSHPEPMSWESFAEETRALQRRIDSLGLQGAPESLWRLDGEAAAAEREAEHRRIYTPSAMPYIRLEEQLVLLDATERLMDQLGLPRPFALAGGSIVLAELYGKPVPDDPDGAGAMVRLLMQAEESRKWGEWQRFPEEIWLATMRCFPRFVAEYRRSYGRDGFDRAFWVTRQAGARLFRIGELEYELAENGGSRKISLHIPSDARIEAAALNHSVSSARCFLAEYFPDWADLPMTCHSWLLSPALRGILPDGSRILHFQAAFDLTETDPEDDGALQWVFGVAEGQKAAMRPETLPEDTSLQRMLKARLLRGEQPGSARGTLVRAFR